VETDGHVKRSNLMTKRNPRSPTDHFPWRFVIYWIAASAVTTISVRAMVRIFVATGAIQEADANFATLMALPVAFLVVVLLRPRSTDPDT
jgi:hypothetical protein